MSVLNGAGTILHGGMTAGAGAPLSLGPPRSPPRRDSGHLLPAPPRPAGCVPDGLAAAKAGSGHGGCREYPVRAGDCGAPGAGGTA